MSEKPVAYVTGGTGFLGSHLIERLVKDGWRVRSLVLHGEDDRFLRSLGVDCVPGDITEPPEQLRKSMTGVTHLFHCAAWVDDWAPLDRITHVNVTGFRNILEAASGIGLERLIYLGSIVVYGDADQVDLDESARFVRTGDPYNHTKIECERLLKEYADRAGLPTVALRPTYIYGERDRQFLPRLCDAVISGRWIYLDGGVTPFTLVQVRNVVDACILAATRDEAVGKGFIIADGESITRRELVELVCEEMGYDPPRVSLPRGLAKTMCPFAEGLAAFLGLRRPYLINRFLYHFAGIHLTCDISRARRLLGYQPTNSIRKSLREAARWMRDNRPDLVTRRRRYLGGLL
ncbi:MAG TPA: NAD-dependent epimerase/dehydratase family protein [Planctomycetota bacterium]|nr:NAD-dependent epimerase/dehydratase family protein [Planctomycetota bacterium]